MSAPKLGTILPTRESLRASDAWHVQSEAAKERIAKAHPVLSKCARRLVGGEVRYYSAAQRFAVVGRGNAVRWFVVRGNDVYAEGASK